jgi:peptidoglycan/xylan/chitin deacetylase (PgdA/CDA1 family)
MKMVSPFLKRVLYPGLARTGYLRRAAGLGPAIVTYHGVLPAGYESVNAELDGALVSAESFRQQLHLLKTRYNIISPEQFSLWCDSQQPLPARSVLLTCDDGLKNTLTDMLPILQDLDLSCLFFVTGASLGEQASMLWYEELYLLFLAAGDSLTLELIDMGVRISGATPAAKRSQWWDLAKNLSRFDEHKRAEILERIREQLQVSARWILSYVDDSVVRRRFLMLSLIELRQLAAAGMGIGAHTLSHPMLSQASDGLAWSEISESRRQLGQSLNREIWALAYPFGHPGSVTQREQEMAQRAGFKCAFLNFGGGLGAGNPLFALPRVHVTGDMGIAEFEAHVSGFYRSLHQYFSRPAGEPVASRDT